MTWASFSLSGNILDVIELFISVVSGSTRAGLLSFKSLAEILSTPVAFLTFKLFIALATSAALVVLKWKSGI